MYRYPYLLFKVRLRLDYLKTFLVLHLHVCQKRIFRPRRVTPNTPTQNISTQIQFPSDWIKKEENGKFGVGGLTPLYTLATFQPDTTEGFKSSLELEINDISKYTGDTKSLTGMGDFEKKSIMLSPEATILSSNEIQINNCPAYQIVYLQGTPNTQEQWKTMLTFFIDCDKEYVMRYTATDNQLYDKYLETVSNMLQTFKVNGC